MGMRYRTRQLWQAWVSVPTRQEIQQVQALLTPGLMNLFLSMQPSEQAHSMKVLRQLITCGQNNPDLLVAALLHDAGKSRYPLRTIERILIVLGRAFFPSWARKWGKGEALGWKRAFVVAEKHPAWGAEMAANAGASHLAVYLIQHHQDLSIDGRSSPLEQELLAQLKRCDSEN